MKVKPLKNFGNFGVEITDLKYPFVQDELDEVSKLCKQELVVVLPQVHYSIDQFYQLSEGIGQIATHGQKRGVPTGHKTGYLDEQGAPIWPGLDMVTAKYKNEKGDYKGLAGGFTKRFNWHCAEAERELINGVERPLPEIVGLHGVEGTEGTMTQICQMVDRYHLESEEKKQELKNTIMQWGFVEGEDAIIDVDDKYRTAETGHGGDWMDKKQPLVRKNISGKEGLHFSPSQITGIVGKTEQEFLDLKKYIMTEYVTPEYTYDHVWQNGDIIYFDQEVSIHRRARTDGNDVLTVEQLEKRLLHRIEIHIDKENFLKVTKQV